MDSDDVERTGLRSAEPEADDRARDSDADPPPEVSRQGPNASLLTVEPEKDVTMPEEVAVSEGTTTTEDGE